MKYLKKDLVEVIAKDTGFYKKDVEEVPTVQLADQDAPAEGQRFSAVTVEFNESSDVEADGEPVEADKNPAVLEDPVLDEGTGIQTATEEPKQEKKEKGKPGRKKKN